MLMSVQHEIISFNFHYLSMLQHQLLTDPLKARYVFNISEEIADLLVSLDSHQLVNLSNTHRMLCDFTITNADQLRQRLQAPAHLVDAHRAHAAILKASQRHHEHGKNATLDVLWGDAT
ncbi:flagellar transcriptional regulator FlhD [Zymobacter palmae]|uniref:Zn-dependent carboxypeptidase n=1 Tax=Zymobacter palmae TaxID=33074 RepID=A0A348HDR9_9GAMM|nr:flagellar transcriptional regulator FlhD [Zymobacter palmae]BBG29771.1 Zn-dependent carboxypeptidase [Zymobacter palmae]